MMMMMMMVVVVVVVGVGGGWSWWCLLCTQYIGDSHGPLWGFLSSSESLSDFPGWVNQTRMG